MSVVAPAGFVAAGIDAGIKDGPMPDLALVALNEVGIASAVFTTSQAAAAPVLVSRKHVADGSVRAVVLNSGGANAATGEGGYTMALDMAAEVAAHLDCLPQEVLVCSTGPIGHLLPRPQVLQGIASAAATLASTPQAGYNASVAIMTTDSVPKSTEVTSVAGWTVGGMVKGAGMIRPDMATMLSLITTDAAVDRALLDRALRHGVDHSFHELNVDGCASTNDTAIFMGSGRSGVVPDPREFVGAVRDVCRQLAHRMASDAEGATRVVTIKVSGARCDSEARTIGRVVADSALVRASFFGGDPNWGRIIGAMGTVDIPISMSQVEISFDGVVTASSGVNADFDQRALAARLNEGDFTVGVSLGDGPGSAAVLTTDLTPQYVAFNGERS